MQIFDDFTPPLILVFARASMHVQFLREALKREKKYDIVEATSDGACIEMLSNLQVDYLIFHERLVADEVDLFLKEIFSIPGYKKLPILMISRNLKKSYIRMIKDLGVSQILREPLDEQEIIDALKKCDPKHLIQQKIINLSSRIPKPAHDHELDFKHRYLLNDQASKKIRTILTDKQSISLLMLELDQFHQLLKTAHATAAEEILGVMDQKIESQLREQDLLISLGGGKYMIILPKTSPGAAKVIAEDIQSAVEITPITLQEEFIHLTTSIGIASRNIDQMEENSQSMEQLHRLAKLARGFVIESKHSGGQIISEGV